MLGAIAGLITAGTGIWSAYNASKKNEQARKDNLREADINRQWQREYAHNQHQWEVADLKKAGLNPILSANKGISAPSGSMANVQSTAKDLDKFIGLGSQMALAGSQSAKNLAEALKTLKTTKGAEARSDLIAEIKGGLKKAITWSSKYLGEKTSSLEIPDSWKPTFTMSDGSNIKDLR